MSTGELSLGSSPTDEECAQVGSENYGERSRLELQQFKRQMERSNALARIGTSTLRSR
jgi:hypothetical protein